MITLCFVNGVTGCISSPPLSVPQAAALFHQPLRNPFFCPHLLPFVNSYLLPSGFFEHFLSYTFCRTFFRTLSYLALRPPTTVVRGNSAFHVEHKHNAAADSAAQTEKVINDRRLLQRGLAASKQTHNRFVKSWKKRFLWVSEDLLFLRWCHGKKKDWQDSEDNVTFIEVANIGDIKAAGDHKFNVILIDDPGKELHFDLGKTVSCSKWVQCLTDLCKDQLAYTLLWDDRDKGTDISIHWRGGDHSAQYQHLR